MTSLTLIVVGKTKEKWLIDAQAEYVKRLGAYYKVTVTYVEDVHTDDMVSGIQKEGEKIFKQIKEDSFVIVCELTGKQLTSPELAHVLEQQKDSGKHLTVIVGGAFGLSSDIRSRANLLLSFSKMTFTHQIARLLILEQVYRGCEINKGSGYHK